LTYYVLKHPQYHQSPFGLPKHTPCVSLSPYPGSETQWLCKKTIYFLWAAHLSQQEKLSLISGTAAPHFPNKSSPSSAGPAL
jgi:hypothetical protein